MTGAGPQASESGEGRGRRHRLVIAGAWALLVGGLVIWALSAGVGPAEAGRRIVDAIQGSAWGPLAYLAIYLARPLFLFSATVLTVAGGFLFGPVAGIALVLVAANASAMLAYAVARWVRGGVPRAEGTGRVAAWTGRLRRRSFETVLSMRLLYLPYDLVSYVAGAARIHAGAFLAGTAIGSAPATIWMVLLGASLESFDGAVPRLDPVVLAISLAMLAAGLVVATILRRREERT